MMNSWDVACMSIGRGNGHWFNPVNLMELEKALDSGMLYVTVAPDKWWQARRNGKTKLWKTRPNDFRIPIKFGFRGTSPLTQRNAFGSYVRIAATRNA